MLLSDEDIQSLTGAKRPSDQARWLGEHGWTYVLDIRGRPRVATEHFLRQMGGVDSQGPRRQPQLRLHATTPPQR